MPCRVVLSSLAGLAVCAAPALAVPPVLDRCPPDAVWVLAVPNFDALQRDIKSMANLLGTPLPTDMGQALMMAGIEKGVKTDGSVAVVFFGPGEAPANGDGLDGDAGEPVPHVVALVPTTDYAALLGNFGVTPADKGGLDAVMIKGQQAYAKDIGGGYAAVGPVREVVEKFTGAEGNRAAFEALAGPVGSAMADKSDLCVIINMAKARPMIERGMKDRMEEMADNMAMMGGEEPNFDAVDWAIKGMVADASGAVATVNIDNLGVSNDFVMAFSAGSRWARIAAVAGKSKDLMSKLPAEPYLLAGAVDYSSPELKAWLKDLAAQAPKAADGKPGTMDWLRNVEKNSGGAFSMGISPAGLLGGLFASTVLYTATSDPVAAVASTKAQFDSMQASKTANVKWKNAEKEIAGIQVDSFEARMEPDPNNPFAAQGTAMIFGPAGGPSGYVAKVDGGVITTLSKNSTLMAAAIGAARGEASLGQDKVMSQVGDLLPTGRAAEGYVGVRSILDTALPMIANFGGPAVNIDVPASLPPAALALTPRDGSLQATLYLPAPTLKALGEVYKQVAGQMGGEAGGPGERPAKKEDAGQPGF